MVEFRGGVLLKKGHTPSIVPTWIKSNTTFEITFEYSCSNDTRMFSNVYMVMADNSGDFKHTPINLPATGVKKFKTKTARISSGRVIGEKYAVVRIWSTDKTAVRIKNLELKVIDEGELKREKVKKGEYITPLNYKVGIAKFHNMLHAEILSKQTEWDLVEYTVKDMSKYDFVIFLGPMLTNSDKQLSELVKLKKVNPQTKIILWWVGSDVLNVIKNEHFNSDLVNNLAYKQICVSTELQSELESLGIYAELVTLIPNIEKYKLRALPKDYTVAVLMPISRLWFFKYKEIVEIMKRTPRIKYLVYGNKGNLDLPKNATSMGWVNNTQEILKKCNCLLRLTHHDGYPQSIIEAILMGRAVITNHDYPGVIFADNFTIIKLANLINKKPLLNRKYIGYYRNEFSTKVLKNKLERVIEAIQIHVPHQFGKNNGIATHIETLNKYSRNNVINNYGGNKVINTQACGIDIPKIDVYTAHSYYTMEDYGRTTPNVGVIRNAMKANRVICVSNYVRDFLLLNEVDKNKITVIPNPIDLEEIDKVKPRKDLPKTFSLFIGNKNVKRAKLFVELAKKYPKDAFVSIGCKHETPKNVIKINSVTREEVLSIMKACTIYLCLSKRESCPYVLLEAMAMKKACIIADFAGQKEIITDGFDGFTFKPDNINSLSQVYSTINGFKCTKVRNQARKTIERRFDARIQVPKYDSIYNQPKISVITFVHCTKKNNRLQLLKDCIESVKVQGYPSYEHIIVDDGSTIPLHKEIIAINDHHLKYYWKPHTGIINSTDTFNYGLNVAQGKYIIYIPSDDKQMPSTLKELSKHLDKDSKIIGVVGNYMEEKMKDGKVISRRNVIKTEESIKDRLLKCNCICGCTIMFRKSALSKIQLPPDNTGFCSDYDLWVRLSEVGKIKRISYVAARYRRHVDATMFKTIKNMNYRKECISNVVNSAKERRGIK